MKFKVEDFHLKHCMEKVYTLLRTSGRNIGEGRVRSWNNTIEINKKAHA